MTGEGEMFLDAGKTGDTSSNHIRTSQGKYSEVSVAVCGNCGQRYGIEALITEKDKRLEEKDTLLIMLKKEITRLEKELTQKNQSLENTKQAFQQKKA